MKKRLTAAAIAALIAVAFLFAQGPVQKVRLWDTNLSHSLLFRWNEDRAAGYNLNWIGITADRTITLQGNPTLDDWFDQDYHIIATPTFAGLYLESSTAAPFLKMTNESDTERDPIIQFAVGATPVVKFTHGVDDSDADNLKWCNTATLVDTVNGGATWGDNLIIGDYSNNRIKNHIASTLVYFNKTAATLPAWTCADGTNYYVTFPAAHLVRKYLIADNSLIWTIGDVAGSGDDQFNVPQGICTDGVYLYIVDQANCRIKKHLCSTGAYIAKVGAHGTGLGQFLTPTGICTDNVHLYITEGTPGNAPLLKKHLCTTLVGVSQLWWGDGHLDSANCQGICTDENFLWLVNLNNSVTAAIFKYTLGLAYVSEYGTLGSGNTQFSAPYGICTDTTHLYVTDSGNARIKKHLLADYTYVSKIGSSGSGDDQFNSPRGICIAYISEVEERTGQLLILHQDGKFFDVYPKLSLYNNLVFREDSVAAANSVEITAPVAVTSYTLTLPGVASGAKKHLFSGATNLLDWGQNVDTDGSPSFPQATLTIAVGTAPLVVTSTTLVSNLNANYLQGNLASAFEPALGNPDADGKVLSSTILGVRSWVLPGGALALDDLTDVDAAAPNDEDVLTWDSGTSTWIAAVGGGGVAVLDDLTDVDAAAPSDNDIIRFDTASGLWKNEALPAAGNHDLLSATHADTTASAVVRGDIIVGSTATPKWTALAKGTAGYVLTMGANEPAWAAPAAGGGAPTMEKRWAKIVMNNATSIATNIAMTTSATLANDDDNDSNFTRYQTGAASGNGAGIYSATNNFVRGHQNQTFYCKFKTYTSIADLRFFIGMFANNTDWNADPSNGNIVALRYVSGTANFAYITKEGVTLNSVDSGLAAATSTVYVLKIVVSGDGTSAVFTINGAYPQTVTLKLPAAATPLGITVWAVTQTNSAKSLSISQVYIEGD